MNFCVIITILIVLTLIIIKINNKDHYTVSTRFLNSLSYTGINLVESYNYPECGSGCLSISMIDKILPNTIYNLVDNICIYNTVYNPKQYLDDTIDKNINPVSITGFYSCIDEIDTRIGINNLDPYDLPSDMGDIFSVIRANSEYYGPILNIRRSSDNQTTDVYYTKDYYYLIDDSLYSTWIGTDIAYVTKWYNQKNLNNNATQTSASAQPIFDMNNKLINTRNNKYLQLVSGIFRRSHTIVIKHGTTNVRTGGMLGSGPYTQISSIALYKYVDKYLYVWWTNDVEGGIFKPGTVACSYDGTNRKLFANGILVNNDIKSPQSGSGQSVTIGVAKDFFNGDIMNVFIYGVCLNYSQIYKLSH